MADARRRRFDCVLVWKYDRFARTLGALIAALQEFRDLGVDFISHTQAIDTTTPMPDELQECLRQALHKAGAVKLMTPELIATLCDHAQGNLRALMNMAGELLVYAAEREARQIDEKLFLETCSPPAAETRTATGRRR